MCNENSNFVMCLNYNNVSDERTWIRIHSNKPVIQRGLVKIGKSSVSVEKRVKQLDGTSVPLPFEIFATMKTVK